MRRFQGDTSGGEDEKVPVGAQVGGEDEKVLGGHK